MTAKTWSLDPSCGELLIRTDVAGPAARMGHRLIIAMRSWLAVVSWRGTTPATAELTVAVDSLEVVRGEGGITPLGEPEKSLIRTSALKSLAAKQYPKIRFTAGQIEQTEHGYRLIGEVEIHGRTRPQTVDLLVTGSAANASLRTTVTIAQSDFGVKPSSLMMGALKVADRVDVVFSAAVSR